MTPIERFYALPVKQQTKILNDNREYQVEVHDWWGCVYDDFKADMRVIGIDVERIFFRGFWSQGDGACFEGRVEDWALFLASIDRTCPALIKLAEIAWSFSVSHKGRYHHENCTVFDVDMVHPTGDDPEDDWLGGYKPYPSEVQCAAWLALLMQYDYNSLADEFEEVFKGHMRWLYNRLEAEYDSLTSEEAVLQALDCNGALEEILDELEEANA